MCLLMFCLCFCCCCSSSSYLFVVILLLLLPVCSVLQRHGGFIVFCLLYCLLLSPLPLPWEEYCHCLFDCLRGSRRPSVAFALLLGGLLATQFLCCCYSIVDLWMHHYVGLLLSYRYGWIEESFLPQKLDRYICPTEKN